MYIGIYVYIYTYHELMLHNLACRRLPHNLELQKTADHIVVIDQVKLGNHCCDPSLLKRSYMFHQYWQSIVIIYHHTYTIIIQFSSS